MSDRTKFTKVTSSDSPSRADMPKTEDTNFQPAKLSDRAREGQRDGNWNELDKGNTYGMGNKFNEASKVTNPGGNYQGSIDKGLTGEYGNFSEKNASIARLDKVGKSYSNSGTVYNSDPIPETYKPATSNGKPPANAVVYNVTKKDRD